MNARLPWLDDATQISRRLGAGLSNAIAEWPLPPLYRVKQNFPRPLMVRTPEGTFALGPTSVIRPSRTTTVAPSMTFSLSIGITETSVIAKSSGESGPRDACAERARQSAVDRLL